MPEIGNYIKIQCDTEGCEETCFATAYLTSEYSGGYAGCDIPILEREEMPEGWGVSFDKNSKEYFYCSACCDKIEKTTGHRPINY